jgi:hypothetical protein
MVVASRHNYAPDPGALPSSISRRITRPKALRYKTPQDAPGQFVLLSLPMSLYAASRRSEAVSIETFGLLTVGTSAVWGQTLYGNDAVRSGNMQLQ